MSISPTLECDKKISNYLLRYFSPFYYIEMFFLSCKYEISENTVKPIGLKAIVLCVIGNGFITAAWCWRVTAPDVFLDMSSQMPNQIHVFMNHLTHHSNYFLLMIGFVIHTTNVLLQRENNVKLLEEMHKVLDTFNIDKSKFRRFILRNWIFCVILVVMFISIYFCNHLFDENPKTNHYLNLLFDIPLMMFDVNMMHAISTVVLMRNVAAEIMIRINAGCYASHSNERICKTIYKCNIGLLQTFELYKMVYQDLILYWIIVFFFTSLFAVEYVVVIFSGSYTIPELANRALSIGVFFGILFVKRLLFIIILCEAEERFYDVLNDLFASSCRILRSRHCGAEKRILKNLKRTYRVMFVKTNLRRLFVVDINLPFQLINQITVFTVVILQFNLE